MKQYRVRKIASVVRRNDMISILDQMIQEVEKSKADVCEIKLIDNSLKESFWFDLDFCSLLQEGIVEAIKNQVQTLQEMNAADIREDYRMQMEGI
jgi:hypothetical protein